MKRANANLAAAELTPLPVKLTPHSLCRTFATVVYALGESPAVVMAEMGHTSPGLALKVYALAMRLGDDEREQLRGSIEDVQSAEIGRRGENGSIDSEGQCAA